MIQGLKENSVITKTPKISQSISSQRALNTNSVQEEKVENWKEDRDKIQKYREFKLRKSESQEKYELVESKSPSLRRDFGKQFESLKKQNSQEELAINEEREHSIETNRIKIKDYSRRIKSIQNQADSFTSLFASNKANGITISRCEKEDNENESQGSIITLKKMELKKIRSKSLIRESKHINVRENEYDDNCIKLPEFKRIGKKKLMLEQLNKICNEPSLYVSKQRKLSKTVKRLRPQAALFQNKTKLKVKI